MSDTQQPQPTVKVESVPGAISTVPLDVVLEKFKFLFDVAAQLPKQLAEGQWFYKHLRQAHMWAMDAINATNAIQRQQEALMKKQQEILTKVPAGMAANADDANVGA